MRMDVTQHLRELTDEAALLDQEQVEANQQFEATAKQFEATRQAYIEQSGKRAELRAQNRGAQEALQRYVS